MKPLFVPLDADVERLKVNPAEDGAPPPAAEDANDADTSSPVAPFCADIDIEVFPLYA